MKVASLSLNRYDFAVYAAFVGYSICSLVIPMALVQIGNSLNFPLDHGGMSIGGTLQIARSTAIVVSLLACGFLAGRIGKRYSMALAMFLSGGGIFLCAFAPSYWSLFLILAVAGLGEGICEGLATPFVQDLHPANPERYVNIAHSFWSVGIAVCVLGAGALLTIGVHWRFILAICGLIALASVPLFLWRESPRNRYPEQNSNLSWRRILPEYLRIIRSFHFWLYCAGMFMGAGAEFCLTFWAASYLQLTFGATAWVAGLGTAAIAFGMFLGRTFFGMIARENNLRKILLAASLGMIPVSLALALISPAFFSSRPLLFSVLMVLLFLCGIGIAPYWPTLQVYGVNRLPELDSTLLYIFFSATGIPGCGFFTWLIGVLGDRFQLRGAFFLIPVTLIGYASVLFVEKHIPKSSPRSMT